MCAIIDANVAHQLERSERHSPGLRFLDRVDRGGMLLVIGGRLSRELGQTRIREWLKEALLAGNARAYNDEIVDRRTEEIHELGTCSSDDPHIIALAQISRARLLYTNDRNLQSDFRNKSLIDKPRGKVYTTLKYEVFHTSHRQMLNRSDLCAEA